MLTVAIVYERVWGRSIFSVAMAWPTEHTFRPSFVETLQERHAATEQNVSGKCARLTDRKSTLRADGGERNDVLLVGWQDARCVFRRHRFALRRSDLIESQAGSLEHSNDTNIVSPHPQPAAAAAETSGWFCIYPLEFTRLLTIARTYARSVAQMSSECTEWRGAPLRNNGLLIMNYLSFSRCNWPLFGQ